MPEGQETTASEETLALSSLVEQLRDAGFKVDTRQYLTAIDLLLACAERGKRLESDPEALRSYLGPIFCTSPEEQTRFADVLEHWKQSHRREATPPDNTGQPVPPQKPEKMGPRWPRPAFVLPLVLLLVSALWYFVGLLRNKGGPTNPTGGGTTGTFFQLYLQQVLFPLALVALAFLVWVVLKRIHRKLVLSRLPVHETPEFATLPSSPPRIGSLSEHELRRLASSLRRPRSRLHSELDVRASIETTTRGAGLPVPVYAARRTVPEYVVLIERQGAEDHQALLLDSLIGHLREQGLVVERYFFREDPRTCFEGDALSHSHSLGELLGLHHGATLLLFLEARRCFNPISSHLEPWVELLKALPRRALFTPEAPYHWSSYESELAGQGFVVLPSGEAGLTAYAEIEEESEWRIERLFPAEYARPFPAMIATEPWRWLDRNAPPDHVLEKLLRQLRGYLGSDGFAWLAACAVYPELNWPLTLHVAGAIGTPRTQSKLPSLARLPWFRHGSMPEWLRRGLLAQLPPEQERSIRDSLALRLEQLTRQALEQRHGTSGLALRIANALTGPVDFLRSAPGESPMRDAVFLGFMTGGRPDALSMEAPSLMRRLFSRLGRIAAARKREGISQPLSTRFLSWLRSALFQLPASGSPRTSTASAPHPPGLYLLCFAEAMERFCYYSIRSLLMLYMTSLDAGNGLGLSRAKALEFYATFTLLVYLTPVLGGLLADRYFGQRNSVLLGGATSMLGSFLLCLPDPAAFYSGLGLLILGTGFFKPNALVLAGRLYAQDDPRRDSAFTLYYTSLSLGGGLAPLVSGTVGERAGWAYGFGAAGVSMALGLIALATLRKHLLGDPHLEPSLTGLEAAATKARPPPSTRKVEWERMAALVIFSLGIVSFWAIIEQAPGPTQGPRPDGFFWMPSELSALNTVLILLLGPVFSILWKTLGDKSKNPGPTKKMLMGFVFLSIGCMCGMASTGNAHIPAPLLWFTAAQFLFTMGELFLGPTLFSLITRLSPARIASLVAGVYFCSFFLVSPLGTILTRLFARTDNLTNYAGLATISVAVGVLFRVNEARLQRMMHEALFSSAKHPNRPGMTAKGPQARKKSG